MIAGIPVRLSIDDADFDPSISCRLQISLDGVLQSEVTAYDIEAGSVTRHAIGEDGQVKINEAGDAVMEETVKGIVVVTMEPETESL